MLIISSLQNCDTNMGFIQPTPNMNTSIYSKPSIDFINIGG